MTLDGKRVAKWWIATLFTAGGLMVVAGMPLPLAIFFGLMLGAIASMCASFALTAPIAEGTGVRAALYKRRLAPKWLAPSWLLQIGRVSVALVGVLLLVALALSLLPPLWAGALLALTGAVGAWKRIFISAALVSPGRVAQLASAVALVIGLAIILNALRVAA